MLATWLRSNKRIWGLKTRMDHTPVQTELVIEFGGFMQHADMAYFQFTFLKSPLELMDSDVVLIEKFPSIECGYLWVCTNSLK